jgi:hypothetical protein
MLVWGHLHVDVGPQVERIGRGDLPRLGLKRRGRIALQADAFELVPPWPMQWVRIAGARAAPALAWAKRLSSHMPKPADAVAAKPRIRV